MRNVIIGNSAAGIAAAENLRKLDPSLRITVISDENERAYSRCLISRFVDGRLKKEELYFKAEDFYESYNIETLLGDKVIEIDRKKSRLLCKSDKEISYDKLLIATGTRTFHPDIEGLDLEGVCEFHSINDAEDIVSRLKEVREAVVIGAGFVGLEAAYALARQGIGVTIIERCSQILPNQFDAPSSEILLNDICRENVKVILDESLSSIGGKNSEVSEVTMSDGTHLSCQLVILATGIRSNSEMARDSVLKVDKGILVDEFLRTDDPNIFAAGDVIEIDDITTGRRVPSATWYNAVTQGKFAAFNMAGHGKKYTGAVGIQNAVEFHEVPAISFGVTQTTPEDEYEVISLREGENIYKKLIINGDRICGMILVGDISKSGIFASLIRNQIDISNVKDKLLEPDFSYAYFKDIDFGEKSPYFEIPACWDSQKWWGMRAQCIYD